MKTSFFTRVESTVGGVGLFVCIFGAAMSGVGIYAAVDLGGAAWVPAALLVAFLVGAIGFHRLEGPELVVDERGLRMPGFELPTPLDYEFGSSENISKARSCNLMLVFYDGDQCPLLLGERVPGAPPKDWPVSFEMDYPPELTHSVADLPRLVRFLESRHPQ